MRMPDTFSSNPDSPAYDVELAELVSLHHAQAWEWCQEFADWAREMRGRREFYGYD
jgi:hypothetical protein